MSERLAGQLRDIVDETECNFEIRQGFLSRIEEGNLTRDENQESHFCAYFAGYDPENGQVFVGHHIDSGLWLFNGGHIDKGETVREAVAREMREEWGEGVYTVEIPNPSLLTVTEIDQERVECKRHFDIWHFVPLSSEGFNPDQSKLEKEFYEIGWKTLDEARELVTQKNTLLAIEKIEELVSNDLS